MAVVTGPSRSNLIPTVSFLLNSKRGVTLAIAHSTLSFSVSVVFGLLPSSTGCAACEDGRLGVAPLVCVIYAIENGWSCSLEMEI